MIGTAFSRTLNLERYLNLLTQGGYLANRDGLYECEQKGRKALVAYDRLLESGLVTEDDIRGTALAMLRELGDGNYKAAASKDSRYRIKKRLTKRGFAVEGGVTDKGRQVLALAADLFELAERFSF